MTGQGVLPAVQVGTGQRSALRLVVAVGIVLAWQPWGEDGASPAAATVSPTTSTHAATSTGPAATSPSGAATPDAPRTILESGDDGDVFGYTATKPASAADCVAQAQEHAITRLETVLTVPASTNPTLKTNDGLCVSDKGGDVAWLRYVGPTPHDTLPFSIPAAPG